MLLDNTIMGAFRAVHDWSTEQLIFQTLKSSLKTVTVRLRRPPRILQQLSALRLPLTLG